MPGKSKVFIRSLEAEIPRLIASGQSALIFGPRQVGKTTLIEKCLAKTKGVLEYLLQKPDVREALEKDPALLIRQVESAKGKPLVFIDEAQKTPEIFDSVQYLIDNKKANFIITGSSARKLRRRGANLLPGRVKSYNLDPMSWGELGWIKENRIGDIPSKNINSSIHYSFEKSLVFGSMPGIVAQANDEDRRGFLRAYTQIYLEEEIRAEALSRKIGAFSRFLELAANESGQNPNFHKLSMEAGVSAPTIKEYFQLLEDTLVVKKVEPYLKNARKRILASPRYFFFDLGARNSLAKMPLNKELINTQKGTLFEHAVILEIIRRISSIKENYKVCYWRTAGGAEVDCVIDMGDRVVPIEIKAGKHIALSELKGLSSFLSDYKKVAVEGYVVTMGDRPEKIGDHITAIPWNYL